jgi:hypothetical protein
MSDVRITYNGAVEMCVAWCGVKPGTVRVWITRGLITRHPDGFDPDEIAQWIETVRNTEKARGAALASHIRYQTRRAG